MLQQTLLLILLILRGCRILCKVADLCRMVHKVRVCTCPAIMMTLCTLSRMLCLQRQLSQLLCSLVLRLVLMLFANLHPFVRKRVPPPVYTWRAHVTHLRGRWKCRSAACKVSSGNSRRVIFTKLFSAGHVSSILTLASRN